MSVLPRLAVFALLAGSISCDSARPSQPGGGGNRDGGSSNSDGGSSPGGGEGRLAVGDFAGAGVSFGAGSRPEDKAGACLTRIIRLAESSAATEVLSSFGWPSLPAGQLLGPDSIAARAGHRYSGSGAATWASNATQFSRVRIDVSGKVIGHDYATKARLSVLAVPFGSDLYPQIDCATGTLTSSSAIISFSNGTETCYLPSTVPAGAGCLARGGRIRLGPAGASVGATVRLAIEDVPFVCGTSAPVRATIHAEAKLSDETQDGVGLHPLLSIADAPALLGTARPGVTVKDLVAKLQPWAEELAAAAELCHQAAAQNASFRAPGALWAGDDLTLTPGDLEIVAALADAAAMGILVAGAFDFTLELRGLVSGTRIVPAADLVSQVNLATGALLSSAPFQRASTLAALGFERLGSGLGRLDPSSAFAKTPDAAGPQLELKQWADDVHYSLTQGPRALSGFTPPIQIEARRFFSAPPNPAQISADPLVLEGTSAVPVEAFFDAFFGMAIDVTWQHGPSYQAPNYGAVTQAFTDRLHQRGWLLGE